MLFLSNSTKLPFRLHTSFAVKRSLLRYNHILKIAMQRKLSGSCGEHTKQRSLYKQNEYESVHDRSSRLRIHCIRTAPSRTLLEE
jgi:hypothetical protein